MTTGGSRPTCSRPRAKRKGSCVVAAKKREKNSFSVSFKEKNEKEKNEKAFDFSLSSFLHSLVDQSIDRMASSSSHRRAERLRSLLSRSEALSADTDAALARCESDLARAAELVAPTVARTQVRERGDGFETISRATPRPGPRPISLSLHEIILDSRARASGGCSAPRRKNYPSRLFHDRAHPKKHPKKHQQALRAARDEIRSSLATSERALEHLDAARRQESVVLAGPRGDNLGPFLMALSKLDEAAAFLSKHKNGLVAAAAAAESVAALRSDGNALALSEFEATMRGAATARGAYHQYQQRQGFAVESTTRGTATTTTTTTATTAAAAAAATQTRLRSLARALVAGGGPEASSPSVVAFLNSEKEARR